MACEWHFQKKVKDPTTLGEPKDYISSLSNVPSAAGKLTEKEPIRMVAHGSDPVRGETIVVGGDNSVLAADKKEEIRNVYETDTGGVLGVNNEFSPLYCFGANEVGGARTGINEMPTLGNGPLLMPPGDIKTIDLPASRASLGVGWPGGKFINKGGGFNKASDVGADLPKLAEYRSKAHDGALLAEALEEVFAKMTDEYRVFSQACVESGTAPNPWGV